MSQLTKGKYMARPTGESSVYENEKGNLILCMEMHVEGEHVRYYTALVTEKDGINIKTVETLKTAFGWDGIDFFWFVDHSDEYIDKEVEVEIEMRPGRDGDRLFPSIKWINVGTGGDIPEPGDRNALLAKYGAKFRAVAGGSAPRKAPPKPPASKPTQTPAAKPSDQVTVWGRYCDLGGDEAGWFDTLAKAVPGVDQGDFTPEQWGQALEWIEQNTLPY